MKKVISLLSCLLVLLLISRFSISYGDDFNEQDVFHDISKEDLQETFTGKLPSINVGAGIAMDVETGRVLFEKNAYSKRAMASTTKILTAILAIEKGNPEDDVSVSERAANIWGSSMGIHKGETYKLQELLYGLMLNSGNDAAIAVAEHIGGTVENFSEMMTNKAKEIGAKNTGFKSPHGLDAAGHFTTAYDLALITRYALSNKTFSELVATKHMTVRGKNLNNTNELLSAYPGADGVKTGYTGDAGRCLVTSATRDNRRILSVVLNCPTRGARAQSSIRILNYAFENYKPYTLISPGEEEWEIPVYKGIEDRVKVKPVDKVEVPLRPDEIDAVEKRIYITESLEAPVYAGSSVGVIEFSVNGEILGETSLAIWSDVRRKGFKDYLGNIIDIWTGQMREGIESQLLKH